MLHIDSNQSGIALKQEFIENLDSTLDRLSRIWDEVGITGEGRSARKNVVILHLKNLLDEMINEEETMKASLYVNIEKFKKEVQKHCQDFQLPEFRPPDGLTILELEKEYRVKAEILNEMRMERMRELKELSSADQQLCDELCETPFYIPTGTVPTPEQMNQLKQHINKLQTEKQNRLKEFRELKQSIQKHMSELDISPNTSFEREVVSEEDGFMLTQENMKSLRSYHERLIARLKENVHTADKLRSELEKLWQRLDEPRQQCADFLCKYSDHAPKTIQALREELVRCRLAKIHNIRRFIDLARNDIRMLWDKCFYTAEQRAAFKPLLAEEFTEEMLDKHEEEVQNLERYYEQHKELFEKVHRREKLWIDFLELERKASNPNRYLNRGGNLLKEEKRRNMLMKELPKIEHEVEEDISRWEKLTGNRFTICEKSYPEYIQCQAETYRIQKEEEKLLRQQQRTKKVEEEMKFGSKPVPVPVKRICGTPSKSCTLKQRRVSPQPTSRIDNPAAILTPSTRTNKPAITSTTSTASSSDKNPIFSETTVSSGEIQLCDPEATLASVVPYQDFAATMNENIRTNCRSSVMPSSKDN